MTGSLVLPAGTALVPALDPATRRFPDTYAPPSVAANAAAAAASAVQAQQAADAARAASQQAGGSTAAAQAAAQAQAAADSAAQSAFAAQQAAQQAAAAAAAGGGGGASSAYVDSQIASLAKVAKTNSYTDLDNLPSIPATPAGGFLAAASVGQPSGVAGLDANGQESYATAPPGSVFWRKYATAGSNPLRPTSRTDVRFEYEMPDPGPNRAAGFALDIDVWIRPPQ